jgi:hypothetical protein
MMPIAKVICTLRSRQFINPTPASTSAVTPGKSAVRPSNREWLHHA